MSVLDEVTNLRCLDYGFDCDFIVEGSIELVVTEFNKHSMEMHGIEYEIETLGQFIRRKFTNIPSKYKQ